MILLELVELIETIFMAFFFDLSINPSIIDYDVFIIPRFLLPYKQWVAVSYINLFLDDLGVILDQQVSQFLGVDHINVFVSQR